MFRKDKNVKKICIAVIMVLLIIGLCTTVQALSALELEQKRVELKAKIDEAGKNLEEVNVELTENLEAINNLDKEIYEYEAQINTITNNLDNVEAKIKETEKNLIDIQARYDHQKKLLGIRLAYSYEEGQTRYLDVLLNSKSIVDFISRYYLIAEVLEYDKSLLDSIERERIQIEQIEQSLITSRNNLKIIRTEQKKMITELENAKVERNSYITKLTDREKQIQEEIEVYKSELDLVELEVLMKSLEGEEFKYVGGMFAWPAPGYYTITSPYGMRFHPVIKVYRVHSGMDIGAPMGSYAIAANDGIVTKSTYSNSYGNMIMIDHGGGVSTLYAHGSELIAQVGDVVSRGDVIMKVGSTGWSTGPHLHFEIRINGQTIDPYPYVTNTSLNLGNNQNTEQEGTNE